MTGTNKNITSIALDAMGGDHGPKVTIPAALKAISNGEVAVSLVGDQAAIQTELDKYPKPPEHLINIVPSEGIVQEDESPALAFAQSLKPLLRFSCHSENG
ncbi:MAG: hypothetical protein Ct9H300mP19_13200 [Dehalococcoidia bacterium]|nr:MAG: hypothetical protein Ct9H300mP19_13200 [Dehalococcoidia bacterium]